MDVAPAIDFDFNSSLNSGGYYTSTSSSPTRMKEFYWEFEDLSISDYVNRNTFLAAVPFAWEEKPGVPKTTNPVHEAAACAGLEGCQANLLNDEFSFDVSGHLDTQSVPAEDLFQGGIIRTAHPLNEREPKVERERGRERGFSSSRLPSSRSRRTRSLPPPGTHLSNQHGQQMGPPSRVPSSSENGSRKWSFLDLFLFRSASDGRAMDTDPLKKYTENFRKHDQDVRNSGSMSKRRGRVSAHELHYNVNRAVSNDNKKKTYLPYKQGILGRFSFNP